MATSSLAGTTGRSYLGGVVRVAYVENTGGFLGLGGELPPAARTALFIGATGIMLAGLVAIAIRERLKGSALLGVALFVAGGASNWVDRVAYGRVVDFLNVGVGPVRTGIFNVADMALMLGGRSAGLCSVPGPIAPARRGREGLRLRRSRTPMTITSGFGLERFDAVSLQLNARVSAVTPSATFDVSHGPDAYRCASWR